jgi:membrane-associated phospholipid phosphatase
MVAAAFYLFLAYLAWQVLRGWPRVAVACGLVLLVLLIGLSRLYLGVHYLSDVVAGATLGFIVGRSVVRVNGEPLDRSARGAELNVTPLVSRGLRGLRLSVAF